jgi:hypothetical protein
MRLSIAVALWIGMLLGLVTAVSTSTALATVTPCPQCPSSIMPAPITVTAQYQPVSTCSPTTTCSGGQCQLEPSCSTYDFVSTTVPCLGGASSTLITETDQILEIAHVSTVLTEYSPCTTTQPARYLNATTSSPSNVTCTSTTYETLIVDLSAPYDECGPLAFPGDWQGSGLCTACVPNPNTTIQVVDVHKCLNGKCTDYLETWISIKPTPTASSTSTGFSSQVSASSGLNTIPVTATFSPSGNPAYTAPVTTTFTVTTSVPSEQVIEFVITVTITFTGEVAPGIQSVVSGM